MKRHPVLLGIIILGILLIVFFITVFAITYTSGNTVLAMGDKVAVVDTKGVIKDSTTIIEQLLRFKKDKSVKAIVLRIDSPGGAVGPTQEIYEEVKKIREKKKVLVSMGSLAASGGYYIACAADKIIANPGTITGSIGVIIEFGNMEELMKKIGFKSVIIKSGEYKDVMSPFRSITDKEKTILRGVVDSVHNQFIEAVVEGRKLKREDVAKIADGRIFSGEQAKALGLVDSLGNLQDAIGVASELAGIKGEPNVIYPPKDRFSILDFLFQRMATDFINYLENKSCQFNYLFVPNRL
ncbi:MAG: signal peptide peptidase SppA [Deltaproteobacteria bacterium CG12_big_fil_rev_8_21_14_0_65_43_10]|nr:MAG: S49 family peptidase [Deltaproteobacteria bacterium CG2_30_43_15]PIQ45891.1 MAG: signal peptide peptidase SppA [Deltaproteobacteria bacterium CG12_big_fil_rev_8_21_14_0_65_43_10]PIU85369.1 MAG: signal peptide peptidase SppA [Deltaproteobacteria bacterium CG06_land_8_20_14_3_00_44_19]PIX22075.1 MAG: signal peptide peptidase SppA [Deltaproteobacteria bacterium CG_4_8_14_3_um_filter_43_13]PIZ19474.1 MAG: signal peptide peptidase SppA [Deltaproteobacteria bacterium CG_4_10_14_0_8_um_filter_